MKTVGAALMVSRAGIMELWKNGKLEQQTKEANHHSGAT
jgi:hypothetical protein